MEREDIAMATQFWCYMAESVRVCTCACVCVTVSPFSDFILSVHMSSHEVEGVPFPPSLDAVVTVEAVALVGGSGPTITFP